MMEGAAVFVSGRSEHIGTWSVITSMIESIVNFSLCRVCSAEERKLVEIAMRGIRMPEPDFTVDIESKNPVEKVGEAIYGVAEFLYREKPVISLGCGGSDSMLACALASIEMGIPFAHIASGMRSFTEDRKDRIYKAIDSVSSLRFVSSERAALNLLYEGVNPKSIYVVGSTFVDAALRFREEALARDRVIRQIGVKPGELLVSVIVQSREIVERVSKLAIVFMGVTELEEAMVAIVVHPRLLRIMERLDWITKLKKRKNVVLLKTLEYLDYLSLVSRSNLVITDSEVVQEEALALRVPCVTVSPSTNRVETVLAGANVVAGLDSDRITRICKEILLDPLKAEQMVNVENPYGDGRAGERITSIIKNVIDQGLKIERMIVEKPLFKMVRVNGKLEGLTPRDIREKGVIVTLIYNENGEPRFPFEEEPLKAGETIRVLGDKERIDKLEG